MSVATLADRLKKLRNEKGLNQKDLAKLLGVSESAYGYYEQGRREPSNEAQEKLANFFDCSIDYLTGHSDTRKVDLDPDSLDFLEEYNKLPTEHKEYIKGLIRIVNKTSAPN